jgi:hypothetical protein
MSEKLSWVFELLDKISSPASAMDKALGGVEEKLHAIKDPLEKNVAALRIERAELQHLSLAHKDAGEHAEGFGERLRHGLETLYFGKEILHSFIEKVHEIGAEIVDSVGFKQRSMLGLTAMLGDKEKAREYFEDVEGFAGKMGLAVKDVMEQTKSLLSAGFDKGEIDVIRRGVADLSVVSAEKAAVLSEQIADIGRNGMMTSRQLLMLRHVLPMDELRKELGVTSDGMNKLLDGSKAIEAGKAISSILKVIRDRYSGGFLGSLAEQDAKTLPKLIDRVKMLPELIISAVAGFEGKGTAPFEHILENISEAFNPEGPSGKRVVARIRDRFDTLGRALGVSGGKDGLFAELAGPHGAEKIEEIFNRVAESVKATIPIVVQAASALGEIAGAIIKIGAGISWLKGETPGGMPSELGDIPEEQRRRMAQATLDDPGSSWLARSSARRALGMPALGSQAVPSAPAQAGASRVVQVHGDIHFHGVKDAEQAGDDFARFLSDHMERVQLQTGG